MAVDWGIALGVVSVIGIPGATGIGVAMAARTPGEFRFARQCFVVAGILIIASWAWLTYGYSLGPIKIISTGALGAVTAIAIVVAPNWVSQRQAADSTTAVEPGLFVEFGDVVLPVKAPADGKFFQLQVQKNSSNGLAEMSAMPGQDYVLTQYGIRYKCQITNYDNAPAIKASIELSLTFRKQNKDTGKPDDIDIVQTNLIKIGKIDSGSTNSFVFFIANFSEEFVELRFPDYASIHRLGESAPKLVPITNKQSSLMIPPMPKPKTAQ